MDNFIAKISEKVKALKGWEVNYIRFSYQIDLNFISTSKPYKYAEMALSILAMKINGDYRVVEPDNLPDEAILSLVSLLHLHIVRIEADNEDKLNLVFENDVVIVIDPARIDEDWEFATAD